VNRVGRNWRRVEEDEEGKEETNLRFFSFAEEETLKASFVTSFRFRE
jgi:hypothetical protein